MAENAENAEQLNGALMKTTFEERDRTSSITETRRDWAGAISHGGQDEKARLRAAGSATVAAGVWAGVAVAARLGIVRIGAIELLFLFAPLVILPLGMELGRVLTGRSWLEELAARLQPVGAGFAIVSICMPPGEEAAVAALGWFLICCLLAADGVQRLFSFLSGRSPDPRAGGRLVCAALAIARIDLAVGGAWFVASRFGIRPMGIQEPIGLLTAVHFHYAGFATATIAAATLAFAQSRGRQPWLSGVGLSVILLPCVVAAGFVISPVVKVIAAVLFSASVAALAVFLRSLSKQVESRAARVLLQIASGAVFAGMVLAVAYAVVDFRGGDVLTIPQMARTHGLLNGFGFCLAGLLGWLVQTSDQWPVGSAR